MRPAAQPRPPTVKNPSRPLRKHLAMSGACSHDQQAASLSLGGHEPALRPISRGTGRITAYQPARGSPYSRLPSPPLPPTAARPGEAVSRQPSPHSRRPPADMRHLNVRIADLAAASRKDAAGRGRQTRPTPPTVCHAPSARERKPRPSTAPSALTASFAAAARRSAQ